VLSAATYNNDTIKTDPHEQHDQVCCTNALLAWSQQMAERACPVDVDLAAARHWVEPACLATSLVAEPVGVHCRVHTVLVVSAALPREGFTGAQIPVVSGSKMTWGSHNRHCLNRFVFHPRVQILPQVELQGPCSTPEKVAELIHVNGPMYSVANCQLLQPWQVGPNCWPEVN
jgi:hypothetical protein